MTTYHRLLLLTALGSAVLTFCLLQFSAINSFNAQQEAPQQLQTMPQPKATEYFAMNQPRMMTLVWQPQSVHEVSSIHQYREIGI